MLLQVGFGKSASEAGLVSFATALGALAMKPLARPLLKRFGFRRALIGASLVAAVGVALPAAFTPDWPLALIFAVLALGGLFRSLQFTALNTLAFADVPTARLSAATSFAGTAQQLAPALGVVLATTSLEVSAMLAGRHRPAGARLRHGLPGGGRGGRRLGALLRPAGAGCGGGGERAWGEAGGGGVREGWGGKAFPPHVNPSIVFCEFGTRRAASADSQKYMRVRGEYLLPALLSSTMNSFAPVRVEERCAASPKSETW